ncbi:type VII secretion protein EssB [Streptococcus loxodontisalivarius]|uniref:Type VII secretion protein EssB n=1 Tax=Streptococcus loxodontisalivarius TaxID=1349415 RepID=A0ABS2PTK9_9STRE|nr:type VII secretion protein EssB [Streptococcus loxodontisalivarius]
MEKSFEFDQQTFQFEKEETSWHLSLKRSDVASQDLSELMLLSLTHPLFLKQKISSDADSVSFDYEVEKDQLTREELKKRPMSESLRVALNSLVFEEALSLPVTFFLHPENIFLTKDGNPKLGYRALPEVMVPRQIGQEDFLRQLKSYIITLFTDLDFMDLYNGSLEVADLPDFLDSVRQAKSSQEVREQLESFYHFKLNEEAQKLTTVAKSRYQLYKYASIWLSVVSLILLIPLIYLVFINNPFKEKMLQADTYFVKTDYTGLIEELEKVAVANIPYTQKYELAYAYIQSQDLSEEQRTIVLNNVSLKSDELYLDYWIQIGRGDSEDAKDTAKRLDDVDLVLYAISAQKEKVQASDSLSGSEREQQLEELQTEYDKYWEQRTNDLNGDDQSSTTTSSASSSASSSSTSSASSASK